MRISDWSSDVCSSDLEAGRSRTAAAGVVLCPWPAEEDRRPGRPLPVAGRAERGGGAAPARRGEPRLADLIPETRRAAGVARAGDRPRARDGSARDTGETAGWEDGCEYGDMRGVG